AMLNRVCDELFSGTGLATDEHGRIRRGHGVDGFEDAAHRLTLPDDLRGGDAAATFDFGRRRVVGPSSLLELAAVVTRLLDGVEQVFIAARLREKVDGPALHGLYSRRDVGMTGDEDGRDPSVDLGQFLLQIEAAQPRHVYVEYQAAGAVGTPACQKLLGRAE